MAKSWNRAETWLALIVLGAGGVIAVVALIWVYMSATATPLHPNPQNVSSVTLTASPPAWAGAVAPARQAVRAGLVEQNLPGVSVAVGVDGNIVWAEGFGWADIETKTPVRPDTRFRIGTASVALSSAAAGLLVEKGRLQLDEEIQTYVPEFPKKPWPVTVRQLMGHVAGVRADGGDEGPLFSEHCDRPADALHAFADFSLLFEPGTRFRYSSYGWILISAAIEAAAAEPFLTFIDREVFEPLGMIDTAADSTTEPIPNRATAYFPRFAADPRYGPDPMRPLGYSCYSGASVFLSTASDLVRFGMAINVGKLLQPATVQLLQAPQQLASGEETAYGLGWDLETVTLNGQPAGAVGHDGDVLGGRVSSLMMFREQNVVVAAISNTSYADTAAMALKIAEVFAQSNGAAGR